MFRNQILCVVRFSMPAVSGFRIAKAGPEVTQSLLYAPHRLERRFDLFERFCLPTLVNQTNQQFQSLLLIGPNFPRAFRDRLDHLIAGHPNILVVEVDPDRQTKMVTKALEQIPADIYSHRTTVRIDDDDMMDVRYIDRLQRLCRKLANITPQKPFAVATARGYYLDLNAAEPVFYEQREPTPLGLGLSLTTPINRNLHAYMINHRLFAAHVNTYSLTDTPNFIRTMHDENDAVRKLQDNVDPVDRAEMEVILAERFGVTWDSIAGAKSAEAGRHAS